MNALEAINELQSYADNSWGGLNEAFEAAISALEKQVPKKPNVGVQHFLKCACCDSVVRITDNYCHECGQMLDWTD
jgi:hypothetical protein